MPNHRNPFRNWMIFLFLLLCVLVLVAGLSYLSGLFGISPVDNNFAITAILVSPIPTLEGSPIARYAELDPALIDALDISPSNYGERQLGIYQVQPVGIYLPRTGDSQFEILAPTPLPTPLPFPTSPPLPLPALSILPTLVPGSERFTPYGGDECAPKGLPVDGILTQRFHRYHSGIDIGVSSNTPVLATHSGQVLFADWSDIGYGYLVIVVNERFITYYAHNTSFNVEAGDIVGQTSIIAWSGSTGNSSGPHVHYETRINDIPVDPLTFETRGYFSC
jgi:murein DD-endopeptidase MepM/ murein hydrolase activator NlpD